MNTFLQRALQQQLADRIDPGYGEAKFRPSGTGCINETWEAYTTGLDSLFIKMGPVTALNMYVRELEGLAALRQCAALRIPHPLFATQLESAAVLVLEFIPLRSLAAKDDVRLGEALAALHDISATDFGFEHDNYIGRSPQINACQSDWWPFWCEQRLRPQWRLAQLRGMRLGLLKKLEQLIEEIPVFFAAHQPRPALLHGDLWSGNLAIDEEGNPVVFDPATYFGDPETDIAMTRMFGALRPAVYATYHHYHPELPGADLRRTLYDLYHWLNHFNLFGVTYLGQVELAVDLLLAQMGIDHD